jgi:hypothetical protein
MLEHGIRLFFKNFSLFLFVIAIVIGIVYRFYSAISFSESIYKWVALLALGFTGVFTFIMHVFFPAISAANIGWATSPFQYEVGIADLTVALLGIVSFKASRGFRYATVLAAMVWLWGDAIGHGMQMMARKNFSAGNAGSWFWMDVIIPFVLWIALITIPRRTDNYFLR